MEQRGALCDVDAACEIHTVGNEIPMAEIALIKVMARRMACEIIDRAVQIHGGGVSGFRWR